MNILFFLHRYPAFGGVETVTTILSSKMAKDHEITIISVVQLDWQTVEVQENIEILALPGEKILSKKNRSFLLDVIQNKKIQIIIHQHSYANIFPLLVHLKNRVNIKILTVEHNTPDAQIKLFRNFIEEGSFGRNAKNNFLRVFSPFFVWKLRLRERKRHRYLYQNSDKYVLLSKRFYNSFSKVTGWKKTQKLASIPNPIVEINEKAEIYKKEKIILYVGRIDHSHKRVDRLINIFKRANGAERGWKLIIVGDGPSKVDLQEQVEKNRLKAVFFEGFQKNVNEYYKKASILCLTSNIEGWPMVLNEAMQHGVIPISYDSFEAVHDIIDHEINGYIVPAFNENVYIDKLHRLIKDKPLRQRLSKNARKKAEEFYLDKILLNWSDLFAILKK